VCRDPRLSEAENHALYGAASNPHGHGHNWVLEVTLKGEPDPVTGMVFDLKRLKDVLHREVVEPMDHRFLNYEVPPFDRVVPTAENLAVEIWKRIEPHVNTNGTRLETVRLYETEDLYVEYFGERR
jgi:6-pyruvoyltetrahydropterin/6-carboxytetrahydropterin synthase